MRSAKRLAPAALALFLLALPALGQPETSASPPSSPRFGGERWTFGGAFGFGFGTVNWVSVAPEVGYLATDRLWIGASAYFQFSNDTNYNPDFNAFNYGFGLYARYFVLERVFATARWNWLSTEFLSVNGTTGRDRQGNLFLGGGYAHPLGGNTALSLELLYDVTGNALGVGGGPFVLQLGVVFGF